MSLANEVRKALLGQENKFNQLSNDQAKEIMSRIENARRQDYANISGNKYKPGNDEPKSYQP